MCWLFKYNREDLQGLRYASEAAEGSIRFKAGRALAEVVVLLSLAVEFLVVLAFAASFLSQVTLFVRGACLGQRKTMIFFTPPLPPPCLVPRQLMPRSAASVLDGTNSGH